MLDWGLAADVVTAVATLATAGLALWLAFRPADVPLHVRVEPGLSADDPDLFAVKMTRPFPGFGQLARIEALSPWEVALRDTSQGDGYGGWLLIPGPFGRQVTPQQRFAPTDDFLHTHLWLRPIQGSPRPPEAWLRVEIQLSSPKRRTITIKVRAETTH